MRPRKIKYIIAGAALVLCAVLLFSGAVFTNPNKLQNGDVVFRKENSFWGDVASSMAGRDGRYSHVGVIYMVGGKPNVIHVFADVEKKLSVVSLQPLAEFLKNATNYGFYRLNFSRSQRGDVAKKAHEYYEQKLPFDEFFSLYTVDAMYCSELVWQAAKAVTKQDIAPQKTEVMGKKIIGVDDLFLGGFMKELPKPPVQ